MSDESSAPETETRPVGGTEYSWCKAVPLGTGITVLALHLSKPLDIPLLQAALHNIQKSHPILRSRLHFSVAANSFSFVTPAAPSLQVHRVDSSPDTFHLVLERELNRNPWRGPDPGSDVVHDSAYDLGDLLHASVYDLGGERSVVALRLHTAASDRTGAVALLRELLAVVGGGATGSALESMPGGKINPAIEDLIPSAKANKPFWARGLDLLGYSLNSFRLANIDFVDAVSPRSSQVVRLEIDADRTQSLVAGCQSRGIKLAAALAAAGLMAAHSSRHLPPNHRQKYGVVTLVDCRSILEPPLSPKHLGFYHSAILNTHDISGEETLWELAKRCYEAFANAKACNKHFTDIGDLNFLMCKALENPSMTPSSSLRTAFISVFEEPVLETSNQAQAALGLEDYLGCASVHSVGPSIAVFDTIRDGRLDCTCVYPAPLHSREQMRDLIHAMKDILVQACECAA